MKHTWKKLVCLAAAGIMTVAMTACGGSSKDEINDVVAGRLYQGSVATIESLVAYDNASMEQAIEENPDMDDFVKGAFESWMSSSEELGAYKGLKENSIEDCIKKDGSNYVVTLNADFENRDAVVEVVYDIKLKPESVGFSANYSMGEKMAAAGMNTIVGIATVFVVLLLLCFIISLMVYIPKFVDALSKKKTKTPEVSAPKAAPAPVETVEEELADDSELVAVIAAAVAAYENTSADGFVVRSIKKSNKRNWR